MSAPNSHQDAMQQIRTSLMNAGIPYADILVFGAIRTNVHITCTGPRTAKRWGALLYQVFGTRAKIVEHVWTAQTNKNTVLRPTVRKGYLIGVAA